MKWTVLTASILAAAGAYSSAPVMANDLMDTVRARGNARAGGPTNGHDAWILDRYGALSGTYINGDTDYNGSSVNITSYKAKLRKLRKRY